MAVVSDTSCITTLLKVGQAELLQQLFGEILVPEAVARELTVFHGELPGFLQISTTAAPLPRLAGTEQLGAGEAEALALAKRLGATLFLTDDLQARRAAQRLGLPSIGLVGLLLLAKERGMISSVMEMLDLLEQRGGLYLSDTVKARARRLAGE